MKIISRLLLITTLTLAANVHATITCSKPKLSKPTGNESIYNFKAVVTCELVGETINLKALKDAYLADITKKGSQFKIHSQQNYDDKQGMLGYKLDVTQSYDTDHGPLSVRANVLLLDNNSTKFYEELRSKSVAGEDEAKYNRFILNEVTLQQVSDHYELTLIKEIDVEEPWYAPEGYFFDKVQGELADSIRKAAMQHAHKICGDKVDAMRK